MSKELEDKAEEYAQGFEVIKVDKFGDIEGTIDKIKFLTDFSNQENKELIELLKECKAQNDDIKMHNEYCEWEIEFEDKVKKAITNT